MQSDEPFDFDPGYRLAARGRQEAEDERLALLERIFDPLSRQRRELVQPGWRCLEVGAGRGSMAIWLAEQVGESGEVVATDIDVTYLKQLNLPNLEVRQHNILNDPLDALGLGSFDLVCSRLLLFWLAGKQEAAIRRMVECLRPGGWLVDEDGDWGMVSPVDPSHPLYTKYNAVWKGGEWWASRGYDPVFGRKLPVLFERCGLENIRHEARAEVVRGASLVGSVVGGDPRGHPRMRAKRWQSDSSAGKGIQGTDGPPGGPVILVSDRASSCLLGPTSRALITPFFEARMDG